MNEQVTQQIIADYAMENANLRITVATLQAKLKESEQQEETEKEAE
ncbi:MAG: hypothetical protein L0K82_03565 [Pisciglobus halotolerans]|nr:hypothetical protein [Pisciglobus halotolerans]